MPTKTAENTNTNSIAGFSERFGILLDRSGMTDKKRVAHGAKRFGVAHNTFKSWYTADKIPGTHTALVNVVTDLMSDLPGSHNVHAIVAWLLAGDNVANPFEDVSNSLTLVEIFFEVSEIAMRNGISFDGLPRPAKELILTKTERAIAVDSSVSRGAEEPLELSREVVEMIESMLAMANTLTN